MQEDMLGKFEFSPEGRMASQLVSIPLDNTNPRTNGEMFTAANIQKLRQTLIDNIWN